MLLFLLLDHQLRQIENQYQDQQVHLHHRHQVQKRQTKEQKDEEDHVAAVHHDLRLIKIISKFIRNKIVFNKKDTIEQIRNHLRVHHLKKLLHVDNKTLDDLKVEGGRHQEEEVQEEVEGIALDLVKDQDLECVHVHQFVVQDHLDGMFALKQILKIEYISNKISVDLIVEDHL